LPLDWTRLSSIRRRLYGERTVSCVPHPTGIKPATLREDAILHTKKEETRNRAEAIEK
jgi:hypothetical protein